MEKVFREEFNKKGSQQTIKQSKEKLPIQCKMGCLQQQSINDS